MALNANPTEQRRFGRRQTHLIGKLKRPGRSTLEVIVRNVSEGGALIDLGGRHSVPYGFFLTIEGDKRVYGCEVRHHYGQRIGVEFVDPALISEDVPSSYNGEAAAWMSPGSTSGLR